MASAVQQGPSGAIDEPSPRPMMCPVEEEGTKRRRRRRLLGGFEYFMYKAHRMGCGLIYCVASLEGVNPVMEDASAAKHLLARAVLLCAKRHPNLRARIVEDERDGEAYLEELPFDEFRKRHGDDAVSVVTGRPVLEFTEDLLLSTPIPNADAPLWQLVLVQADGGGRQQQQQHLVALAHHTIMDGESVVLFLREVVENLNRLASTSSSASAPFDSLLEGVVPLRWLEAQDELYARLLPGVHGDDWRSRLAFFCKRIGWLVQRPTVPAPEATTADVGQRRNRILSTRVEGRNFERLRRRCKEEGTTVTAALAAAVMLELKTLVPESSSVTLKVETMVNLRGQLAQADPALRPCLHLFAAPIDMVGPVANDEARAPLLLWARARAYKRELTEAMVRGQWRHQVAAFHTFRRGRNLVYRMLENHVAVGPTQGRVKAAAISNLGSLDEKLAAAGSGCSISRLQWGITEHGIGQYVFVAASSQRGALNLTLTFVNPLISPARGHALLAGIVRRLLEVGTDTEEGTATAAGKGQQDGGQKVGAWG